MDFDESLTRLNRQIDLLKIEYERFFNGFVAIPPDAERQRISDRFRSLRARPPKRFADRFRLSSLEARFNSLNEIINRRLRDGERALGPPGGPPHRPPAQTDGPSEAYDPHEGVVLSRSPSEAAVKVLFEAIYADANTRSAPELERFDAYLRSQISHIRKKTGCNEVRFRISGEGGTVRLKAKAISESRKSDQ